MLANRMSQNLKNVCKNFTKTCKFKDAKFLMNVYNSAVKGGFYNSTKMVVLKDHNKWLKSKLKSKSSKIYIGYKNKKNLDM